MSNELQEIKLLADELDEMQRLEFDITKDKSTIKRLVGAYIAKKSIYDNPEQLKKLSDELAVIIRNYQASANKTGKLLSERRMMRYLDESEKRDVQQRELARFDRLSQRRQKARLKIYFEELRQEGANLRGEIKLFKMNAKVAGLSNKEMLAQLQIADRDKAGLLSGFAKRVEKIAVMANRREKTSREIEGYMRTAKKGEQWQWITISGSPCPDCASRAGKIRPMAVWERVGLPGSGRTVCGKACRCNLMPRGIAEDMFPTVKQFRWTPGDVVLATKGELRAIHGKDYKKGGKAGVIKSGKK